MTEAAAIPAEVWFSSALLVLMVISALGVVFMRNLFGLVMVFGIYSFLMATVMVAMDAVDVAMTEASVGAGLSTVLLLGTLHLTRETEAKPFLAWRTPLVVAVLALGALVVATIDLPAFGSPDQPANTGVGQDFMARSIPETGVPNVVTAVLASYRGYDTLGEVVVVFAAGIGVLALLGGLGRRRDRVQDDEGDAL